MLDIMLFIREFSSIRRSCSPPRNSREIDSSKLKIPSRVVFQKLILRAASSSVGETTT